MESVPLTQINENIGEILEKIRNGQSLAVTFEGREIGVLFPAGESMEKARRRLEQLRETAFVGDLLSPINEDWEAMK